MLSKTFANQNLITMLQIKANRSKKCVAIAHREIKFLGTILTYTYTSSNWSSRDALLVNPSTSRQLSSYVKSQVKIKRDVGASYEISLELRLTLDRVLNLYLESCARLIVQRCSNHVMRSRPFSVSIVRMPPFGVNSQFLTSQEKDLGMNLIPRDVLL